MHEEKEKKVYASPELVQYGPVVKLTGAGSSDGIDGAGGKNNGPDNQM